MLSERFLIIPWFFIPVNSISSIIGFSTTSMIKLLSEILTLTLSKKFESYFTKVKRHSLNYVTNELNYIAERAPVSSGLWITDSNWAMYKWDEDIAKHIASLQKEKDKQKQLNQTLSQ